jgi:hypothetical protein
MCCHRDHSMAKRVIFVVLAPLAARAEVALSARMALRVEPTHHDPGERLGPLDIREMAGLGDFLVTAAGNETGETAFLVRRRPRPASRGYRILCSLRAGCEDHALPAYPFFRSAVISSWP